MGELAIEIKNLSKRFKDRTVIDQLNLTVDKGETIGIIGANGTGKSTLLRILSGIIKPSEGSVRIHGSVTSILEVGNGFHPDLTGRENCYLSARLRGYHDDEISAGIEHVIAYSELYDAIDQPVKFYSNGMYLRLAFAVFERFNSDILLLDEVLAVGDFSFKQKVSESILKFKREGKTMLIVTHNMTDIFHFCDRALYLSDLHVIDSTDIRVVVNRYIEDEYQRTALSSNHTKNGDSTFSIIPIYHRLFSLHSLDIQSEDPNQKDQLPFSVGGEISLEIELIEELPDFQFHLIINDANNQVVLFLSPFISKEQLIKLPIKGKFLFKTELPGCLLNTGRYSIAFAANHGKEIIGTWSNISTFTIHKESWMEDRHWSRVPTLIYKEASFQIITTDEIARS